MDALTKPGLKTELGKELGFEVLNAETDTPQIRWPNGAVRPALHPEQAMWVELSRLRASGIALADEPDEADKS